MMKKVIGSILMIIGTAVGAGMLALPMATAEANFQTTLFMMLCSWTIMTVGALAILEVNLNLPSGANFISMANATLGKWAGKVTWFVYLLLLYSLLCAYLSGVSDIFHGLLAATNLPLPSWSTTLLALALLGIIVMRGIGTVDVINRGLMSVKLLAYIVLILTIAPHVTFSHLTMGNYTYHTSVFMVIITSFGFAHIIPTLRMYLQSDVKKLKTVILVGSFLAFLIYFFWVSAIQGLIGREGDLGLMAISHSYEPNSLLIKSVSLLINNQLLNSVVKIFISICAVTSFLGVALAMTDFIADGINVEKRHFDGLKVYAITFLPPLFIVLLAPGIFIKALSYAGFCCVFLLILLPVMMLYRGRYQKAFEAKKLVPGGKSVLILAGMISVILLILQIL